MALGRAKKDGKQWLEPRSCNYISRSRRYDAKALPQAILRQWKRFGKSRRVRPPRMEAVPRRRAVVDRAVRDRQDRQRGRLALAEQVLTVLAGRSAGRRPTGPSAVPTRLSSERS